MIANILYLQSEKILNYFNSSLKFILELVWWSIMLFIMVNILINLMHNLYYAIVTVCVVFIFIGLSLLIKVFKYFITLLIFCLSFNSK